MMTAMSQAYSLKSLVAIIMKFWSVNTLLIINVAMPNTAAAAQTTIHDRFLRKDSVMNRLGTAKRMMSQLNSRAPRI